MKFLWLSGAGVAFGVGLWLLYRGRLYLAPLSRRLSFSPRADRLLGAVVAGLIVLLLGIGCRLVVLVWNGV